MAIDPICGMTVDEKTAAGTLSDGGDVYYLCSADCMKQFAAKIEAIARLTNASTPIGTICQIHGPVVDIICDHLPPLHQALYARINHETYTFEAHQHLDEKRVRAITLNRTSGLQRGMPVFDT